MQKILCSAIVLLGLTSVAAYAADSFVWKDPHYHFSLSFPDSWSFLTKDVPTTRLRIGGPVKEDFATCRVKVVKDGRLKIYPKRLMSVAVKEKLNCGFWEEEISEYERAIATDYCAPASLGGQGDATSIKISYVQEGPDKEKVDMHGEVLSSIYGDMRYTISCTSKLSEYKKYKPLFSSIIHSIELDQRYQPSVIGDYPNFLKDEGLYEPFRTKPGTITRETGIFQRIKNWVNRL